MQTFINAARSIDLAAYRRGQTPAELTIGDHGALSITYAPFDFINRSAELVLVGLTPGRTQAANAIEALQQALAAFESAGTLQRLDRLFRLVHGGQDPAQAVRANRLPGIVTL